MREKKWSKEQQSAGENKGGISLKQQFMYACQEIGSNPIYTITLSFLTFFYTDVLGMKIVSENYRTERDSWKADCWLDDNYVIELFSFPNPPARPSYPEAAGLRHLAFEVDDLSDAIDELDSKGIAHEPIRTDEYTDKRFVFFSDPDGLPIELYEK